MLVNAGQLHLDQGEIDRAAQEAIKAYELAQQKHDHILMARARVLQAAAENGRVEEELEAQEEERLGDAPEVMTV